TGGTVSGTIPKDAIRRIVQRHMNEMKFCYERALAGRPDLEGRISVKFVITGSGGVQTAVIENSSVGNAAMEQCVVGAVRRWTFPKPADGGVVIVSYPFAFTSSGN
ncbi:MAG TPA: AgmX/PglI C-terminal domain-containing protein, partial [Polyangia bacterium]|nr:AgmX/PglI C-terminal domain-containing protein [Polyangia bacterium]